MNTRGRPKASRRRARPRWIGLSDEQLLGLRLCDLEIDLEQTVLRERVERLNEELEVRGLRFRPHVWVSSDWFSPDGVPGVAVPFFVTYPRLMQLEERQVLEVEGGTPRSCMQLLRHETAHAFDSAYRLHRRKDWRETFGKFSTPYTQHYQPKPYSKSFVLHLDSWYAQSHPAEDFAETFAVWLDPNSRWRKRYQGWPALKKLLYVDRLMKEIANRRPLVTSRERVDPASRLKMTLREYYEAKKRRYGEVAPSFYDRDLRRLFPAPPEGVRGRSAAALLRKARSELRRTVAYWTGEYQYTIDQVLLEMIERCQELGLTTARDMDEATRDAFVMLAVQTMNYLHAGNHRLAR